MTKEDYQTHVTVMRRAIERHKATPNPNPSVLQLLEVLEQEYRAVHEILEVDPPRPPKPPKP